MPHKPRINFKNRKSSRVTCQSKKARKMPKKSSHPDASLMRLPCFHTHLKTALIVLSSLFLGQSAFAQTDPPPPMENHEMVEEEVITSKPAPYIIPKHWKTGKPQAGRKDNKYYGYVLNDSILIPFEYEELDITYSDFMVAKRGGLMGAINKKGETVLPFVYKNLNHGKKGTLIATYNYLEYGLISPANEVLMPLEFNKVLHINDSMMIFNRPNKQVFVQVLNQQEIRVLDTLDYALFESLGQTVGHVFKAQAKDGKMGLIDLDNRVLLPFEYHDFAWQHNNMICFKTENALLGLVNFQHQLRVPATYPYLNSTKNPNLFLVRDAKMKTGIIDSTGNIIVPHQYYSCWVIENLDCIKCKTAQGHYALWDAQGKQLSKEIYEEIYGNKAVPNVLFGQMPDTKKWQVIGRQGQILCPELVDSYYWYSFGFQCEKDELVAIFDLSGRQVTDFKYKNASRAFSTEKEAEQYHRRLGLPDGTRLVCRATNAAGVQVYVDDMGREYGVKK